MREVILQELNLARASGRVCGTDIYPPAAPVVWNDNLFSAAAKHSLDMATRNYFSHISPEGVSFGQRVWAEGYPYSAGGENIAAGQGTAAGVMASWMGSSGHCRNVMNPAYADVAVACVVGPESTYGLYWTMELGRR